MAATLTPTQVTRAGVVQTLVAATGGGDSWTNTGKEFLIVKNGGGSPITVTLVMQATGPDGTTVTSLTVSVTNGNTDIIGPFPSGLYNDATALAHVTYSGVTSVTVGVFYVNQNT